MLFSNQLACKNRIQTYLSDTEKNVMIIEGKKNIGKMHVITETIECPNVAYFKNIYTTSRKYSPFYSVIDDKKDMFTSLLSYDESIVKDSKRAPNLFSNIIKVVKESNMNSDLTNEEKNILSYIKRIVKRKKDYTFVVENICAWNHDSISLFNSLFRLLNINKNHAYKWIFTSNCKEDSLLIKNEFTINTYTYDLVIMDSMTIEDFTSCLKFFDDQNFYSLNDYSSLYKIIESDIEAIKYICNSKFMDNRVDEEVDKFSLIKKIIEDKIKALTSDSDLIFQTMEYIGILNKMVSVDELSYFLEITEGKIREVVEEAYSNYLLNYNDVQKKYIDFALDIIKTIYSEMSIHDRRYYDKIAKCIKKYIHQSMKNEVICL